MSSISERELGGDRLNAGVEAPESLVNSSHDTVARGSRDEIASRDSISLR